MITNVVVKSAWEFQTFLQEKGGTIEAPFNAISIREPFGMESNTFAPDSDRMITLKFHDCPGPNGPPNTGFERSMGISAVPFSSEQAKEILDFVEGINRRQAPETLIVHCYMGISRSGAIASFIVDMLGLDFEAFHSAHSWIQPNIHVVNTLRMERDKR